MYNTPYYNNQANLDRLNNQIAELEKIKAQIQQPIAQPTNLTQNFQLAPTNRDVIKYAASMEEVQREQVIGDTPYFSKDMTIVWIKNTRGGIKTYELNEIIPKDEKDIQIELLQTQLNELRKEMRKYDEHITNVTKSEDTTDTEWDDETNGESVKESKPTSIQRISKSKGK
jgi:prefoldin subunit 5